MRPNRRGRSEPWVVGMNERLSSIEVIMWRVGQDPTLRMTVGNLMILDRPPPRDALVGRLVAAAEKAPRLRRLPDDPAIVGTRLTWVEEAEFDAGAHVRTMAVPSPGDRRQVLDLVALLEPSPFDPDRSPWDVTVIEGLDGGRAALYLRAHHALTDGMGGVSLMDVFLDEPSPPEPAPSAPAGEVTEPTEATEPADTQPTASDVASPEATEPAVGDVNGRRPGTVTVTLDLTRAAGAARGAAAAAMNVDPLDAVVRGVQRSLDAVSSLSHQVVVAGGPLSSLPASRSMTSHFEVLSIPGARQAALALGGSRNDLLVAAAAAGLGAYQARLGLPTAALRLAMPAGRHREGGSGGNWFAPTRIEVPTGGEHPGPEFGVVAERLARARREPAVRLTAPIASAVSRLPSRLLLPALHAQARAIDFIATALPGLRGPRHIGGAAIEESYPFGPRLGCLMNLTAFGNSDRLDVGITLDPTAVSEPDVLLECLDAAFKSFAPTSEPRPARPRATRA